MNLIDRVRSSVGHVLGEMADAGELGELTRAEATSLTDWSVGRPRRADHGDLATNVAMVLAKRAKKPPRTIAEPLAKRLADAPGYRGAEVAGPGFVNLRLHPRMLHDEMARILEAREGYGRAPSATGERILIEFVSANPTGPINVASGRNAILGDAVARLLEATGHRVTREYYINDFGNQIRLFATSVRALAKGEPVPADGYHGAYVGELAEHLQATDPAVIDGPPEALGRACVMWMLRGIPGSTTLPGIRRSLRDIAVEFDSWFSEESLHRWGMVGAVLQKLDRAGFLVEHDGAVFFSMGQKGQPEERGAADDASAGDKDRVVKKSDGSYTYFASDIAYFSDKLDRGFERLINVLAVDHHGYVPRIHNALEALGLGRDKFEPLLYQLVYIYRGGEMVRASKRAGTVLTIEEVSEEVDLAAGRKGAGSDAIRFFFLSRGAGSPVEFDIDLAKQRSLDNPVFYVQYGYARLCSIVRRAEELGIEVPHGADATAFAPLESEDELAIARTLAEFPSVVEHAAQAREPHRIVFYVQELARSFQSYFTRMKSDPILPQQSVVDQGDFRASWDMQKTRARLAWILAIREVYGVALDLLGVSAQERMDRPSEDGGEASDDP